ncbi:MAG: glycosyltransferase family 4 protein [Verrucomicrobiaceae bacterium]|nr:glycosyltransferase family 4 protein [Verrucomicrobiaceae bacterium]
MPRILLSHVTGNVNSRQAAWSLAEHGWLEAFHTTLAWKPPPTLEKMLPRGLRETLSKRRLPPMVAGRVCSHPLWEVLRLMCRTLGKGNWLGMDQVAERFDQAVAEDLSRRSGVTAVYAYMDTARITFEAARARGVKTIYELPTPYWRATREIIEREKWRYPDWAVTLPEMNPDSPKMRSRDAELALADVVIVPSAFVRDSLALAPQPPRDIRVVPYGCPEPDVAAAHRHDATKPLKLLYVGTLGQGKGLADLDASLRLLKFPVDLTLIGSPQDGTYCAALNSMLSRHRWLSGLSREQVMAEMRKHDLLVLPTHYEGMALVIGEALSCGLPVITTTKAGAEPLIESQNSGFILPEGDIKALASQIGVLHNQRDMIASSSRSALVTAKENSWGLYRNQFSRIISI